MKTAEPTTYPKECVFTYQGTHVDLQCATPGAVIYYTTDGSTPTYDSPVYHRENGLIPIQSEAKVSECCETVTEIRAFAKAEGLEKSPVKTFTFVMRCPAKTSYYYRVIRMNSTWADLFCIEDFDSDKMYLLVGSSRAVLFDAGFDADGDLKHLVDSLCHGIPYDLVVLHGHPDHVMQANHFIDEGITCYLPALDIPVVKSFGYDLHHTRDIREGDSIDLGNSVLDIYSVPGHTPGSVVAVERETGYVFSSDAFGSNRADKPDSAWLQFDFPVSTMDRYLASIKKFRMQTDGKITKMFCGHNNEILDINPYLDHLEAAVQSAVDFGKTALSPTLRSAEESFGSQWIAVKGNYQIDQFWAAVNVKHIFTEGITPDNNCLLSWIQFENAVCIPSFHPMVTEYRLESTGTKMRYRIAKNASRSVVTANGAVIAEKEWQTIELSSSKRFSVCVTAPDGTEKEYHFVLSKE